MAAGTPRSLRFKTIIPELARPGLGRQSGVRLVPVRLESRKYGGGPHRFWDRLWEVPSPDGLVLWGPRPTRVRESDGRVWVGEHPVLMIFPSGRDWNAVALLAGGHPYRYYCNVCLPPERAAPDAWTYIDLDLDVVVSPGGACQVLDREELAHNARRFGYPPGLIQRAEKALSDLLAAIHEPWGPFVPGAVEAWVKRIRSAGRRAPLDYNW